MIVYMSSGLKDACSQEMFYNALIHSFRYPACQHSLPASTAAVTVFCLRILLLHAVAPKITSPPLALAPAALLIPSHLW